MWQQIASNKKKSKIILFISFVLMIFVGSIFGVLFCVSSVSYDRADGYGDIYLIIWGILIGGGLATIVWLIQLASAFANGNNTVLKIFNAYKLPSNSHKILKNVVEEMSIAAGLPKPPQIYVIDSNMPNAFACGINPNKAVIAVTTGLLTRLNRDELQGVIAHEISHIVNRDSSLLLYACVMFGTILLISDAGLRIFLRSSGRRSSSSSKGGGAAVIILIVLIFAILSYIITPVLIRILYSMLSKKREYLADACAAQLTRYPAGLASALYKISNSDETIENSNGYTNAMFIVNPKETEKRSKSKQKNRIYYTEVSDFSAHSVANSLSSGCETHPPTEERIKILLNMTGAGLKDYNEALKSVSKRSTTILSKENLKWSKDVQIREPMEDFVKTSALPLMGIAANKTAVNKESSAENMSKNKNFYKERKREAEDIIWKANGYIFKRCDCLTKLKFPISYKGQEIKCPHCGKTIKVEE